MRLFYSILVFLIFSVYSGVNNSHISGENSISLFPYLYAFYVGYACAVIEKRGIESSGGTVNAVSKYLPVVGLFITFITIPAVFSIIAGRSIPYDYFHGGILWYGTLWGGVLYACLQGDFFARKVICAAPFRHMGTMSFSFYLLHPFLIEALDKVILVNDFVYCTIFFVVLFVVCTVSYRFIEVKCINYSHRIKL